MAITNPSTLLASFDLNETNISAPAAAQISDGYVVNEIPTSDNHGYMFNEWYKWINYYKKNGMAQYDAALSYNKHSRVMRNQNIYRSLSDANSGNDPLTSPTFWMIDQWRMNTVTHDMTSDANYTLTDEQNNFGKVIVTDTNPFLTTGRDIIVSDEEKDFIAQNDTLQTLTFKTSGGTGIAVEAGFKTWLLCDGTNVIESVTASSGVVLQEAHYQTGAVASGTTVMVNDNTIPQQTEGDQYMQLAFTPKSSTSTLRISAVANAACSANTAIVMCLFRDATADAIATVNYTIPSANNRVVLPLTAEVPSNAVSLTTFKVRIGGLSGTLTFNGANATAFFGGTYASTITITEYEN